MNTERYFRQHVESYHIQQMCEKLHHFRNEVDRIANRVEPREDDLYKVLTFILDIIEVMANTQAMLVYDFCDRSDKITETDIENEIIQ